MNRRDRTIAELAREAIDVQNASNLRGVLSSWHTALCQDCVGHGSHEEANLNALYLSKVTSLLSATADGIGGILVRSNNLRTMENPMDFAKAYDWAEKTKVPK